MDRLQLMRAFVATVEAGSFTAAADRLGASGKVVSKHVGELEAALGVRLLHRTTRKLSLTDAGTRYLEGARGILDGVEHLEASLGGDGGALRGRLRLSAPATFGELHLPRILAAFRQTHPGVEIDLRLTDRFVDLAEDGFDLALRIGALPDSRLMARRLARTELWVVASPDFVAGHGTPETPEDLTSLPAVHDANLRTGRSWPFMVDGQTRRIAITASVTVDSARAVAELASQGEGVALCPDYVAASMIERGELIRLLADHASLSLDIHAVFLDGRLLPARTRAMIGHLAASLREPVDWTKLTAATP